ncbi:MAG: CotH kinase family protein [Flavobacteriales bacterium]|nr:CotH kinase family protein [Flavobacteriales bacterium]
MAMLERGAPLDSIAMMIDVESLIELACFDLWTGRADADLNMRCYRPAQPGGRWRWVLYDMDLWAPPEDPSVERLCDGPFPFRTVFAPVARASRSCGRFCSPV